MSKNRFLAVLFVFLAVFTLGLAEVASACDQDCVNVGPGFCRRCQSTGGNTGITCKNSGSCGCFYTQNNCDLFAAAAPEAKADFLIAENETPAQAPAAFDFALVFAGR